METRIKLDAEELIKSQAIIYCAGGAYGTCKSYREDRGVIFILIKTDDESGPPEIEVNIDQLVPFGQDYYAFNKEAFEKVPVSFIYSWLSSLLTDPSDYDVSVLAHLHTILDRIVKPTKMGKISDLHGKVMPGDILYYVEDGYAYPTIVRSIKNHTAKAVYTYGSTKLADCDEYNLDINNGELRHLATRDYPSVRHVLAEVEKNSTDDISGKIRPFMDEEIAAQMIESLIKG